MRKLILITIIINASLGVVTAQVDPNQREERLATYRAEVFTRVLRLNAEEAQRFWPVYNSYLDRREQLQRDFRAKKQEDQMSDTEVEEQIKVYFEKKQRDLDLEKELYQNLRPSLPLRKIAKIPMAEREFRESLVRKLQENRQKRIQNRQQGGGNRGQ